MTSADSPTTIAARPHTLIRTQRIKAAYIVGLAVIAVAGILIYLAMITTANRQEQVVQAIEDNTQQRMNVQRTAFIASLLMVENDPEVRTALFTELSERADFLATMHAHILEASDLLPPEVYHLYFVSPTAIDTTLPAYLDHVRAILLTNPTTRTLTVQRALDLGPRLREAYNTVVLAYDRMSHRQISAARHTAGLILAAILGLIGLEALLIFRPMERAIHHEHRQLQAEIAQRQQAERRLQQKHDELEHFFSLALDLLCIADTDGRFIKLSRAWEVTFGYSVAELEGQSFTHFIHPDDIDATRAALSQLSRQLPSLNFTNRYRRKDGSYRFLEWRSMPRGDLIYAVARDVTERIQMEEALRQSEQRFRTISEMITHYAYGFRLDADGHLDHEWTAGAFAEITGYTPQQLDVLGGWSKLIYPEDMPIATARFHKLLAGQEAVDEFRIINATGHIRWLRDYGRPVWDAAAQRVTFIYGAAQDITDQKHAAQEALAHTLEREKMRLLADFMRDTSHDLRTPLSIIGTSVYLARKVSDPAVLHHHLDKIERQAAYLTRTLNALNLMIALDGLTEADFMPVRIRGIVEALFEKFEARACQNQQGFALEVTEPLPDLHGSSVHLQTALSQLVENALIYTPQEGQIDIHASQQGDCILVEVHDTGVGISDTDLPFIFDRFYKADTARQQNDSGPGLGLAIAKKIIGLHHGSLTVESQVGSGSCFRVLLPTVLPPAPGD